MSTRPAVLCALSLIVLFLATGCSKTESPAPVPAAPGAPAGGGTAAEGKALFEGKCGVCHGLDRATGRRETKGDWARIVKEMQEKRKDFISDAEASGIVDYLAAEHGKR